MTKKCNLFSTEICYKIDFACDNIILNFTFVNILTTADAYG